MSADDGDGSGSFKDTRSSPGATPAVRGSGRWTRRWAQSLQPGITLAGRYLLKRYLDAGGMGEVWEAEDLTLRESIALKTIRPDRITDESRKRLQSEVKLARRISHPSLCRIHEFNEHILDDGTPISFLTMELLRGKTLSDVLKERGSLPVDEALSILKQLAAGLDAAHAEGIVHRDFKSANIFLEPVDGGVRAVITDFGLARDLEAESRITGDLRSQMGTPAYMAPEQVEGGEVGQPSDLFALGIVAFELFTGQTPFGGTTPVAVAMSRLTSAPKKIKTVGVPAHFDSVFAIALARKPEARFGSAARFVAALEDPTVAQRTRLRRRLLIALGVVAVVGLFAGAGVIATRMRSGAAFDACPGGVCDAWSTNLSGSENQDQVEATLVLNDGSVLVGASLTGTVDLSCGPIQVPKTPPTGLLVKFSKTGVCEWNWLATSLGQTHVDRLFQGPSGRIFAYTGKSVPEDREHILLPVLERMLLEVTPSGTVTRVPTPGAPSLWDRMVVDLQDRPVIAAAAEGLDRDVQSPHAIDVLRLLPSGDTEWKVHFASGTNVRVTWMDVNAEGDIGLIGNFRESLTIGAKTSTSNGGTDMFFAVLSGRDGHLLWHHVFGTVADEAQDMGLIADAKGNWYGVGEMGLSVFVTRWSPTGEELWSKRFGGTSHRDAARRVVIGSDGNPIVFGRFLSSRVEIDDQAIDNVGGSDLYLARFDAKNGSLMAIKTYPAVDAPARALAIDAQTQNVVIGGRFDKRISFGQGSWLAQGEDGYIASLGVVP